MNKLTTSTAMPARALKAEALASLLVSFERLCLAAGVETLTDMTEADARAACGPRHARGTQRTAHPCTGFVNHSAIQFSTIAIHTGTRTLRRYRMKSAAVSATRPVRAISISATPLPSASV